MRRLIAILFLASTCSMVLAATGHTVTKAYVDHAGRVHIATDDGREQTIRPSKWQAGAGFEAVKIAPDGKTVGWLAKQMFAPFEAGTNYAYAISLELDIWRDGRVIRRISSDQGIQNWTFLKGGNEAAYHTAPPHGQVFFDCTLFDVNTGKELARWSLDRRDYVVPNWAKPLLVNAPLPGPDELSDWFPNTPAPPKNASQPKQ
jgi:hypothetical protein